MLILDLARRSLRNRLLPSILTVLSIAFSVALLVGIENIRNGLRASFTGTISGTDLIVGPQSGSVQLLLYSVFGMGSPTGNLSPEAYEHFRTHPAVAWTIPYALGDSHRGYRVIGTTDDFYEHFRYRGGTPVALAEGRRARDARDVVLGSEVAERLEYRLDDGIVVTHGMGAPGIMDHDEAPFTVVGILERTGTPVDRALYVTLEGVEAMHEGWEDGVPPAPPSFSPSGEGGVDDDYYAAPPTPPGSGDEPETHDHSGPGHVPAPSPAGVAAGATPIGGAQEHLSDDHAHDHDGPAITSFFLGTTSRFEMLTLQREINEYSDEPLMAIAPGIALAEMWRSVGYAEDGLKIVSFFVVIVGLLGMLVSLYTALDARRREMAIFRALGAGPKRIVGLLVVESGFLAFMGALVGVGLVYGGILVFQAPVEARFGLLIPIRPLGSLEWLYLGAVVSAGFVLGLVPAVKAYRNTLSDGLSPRS